MENKTIDAETQKTVDYVAENFKANLNNFLGRPPTPIEIERIREAIRIAADGLVNPARPVARR
jgi:hypothetical protein